MQKKKKYTISIVTCTFNSNLKVFRQVLEAIKSQNYPKYLIEHIIMDAGSTNGTVELARKYGCKVVINKDLVEDAQVRASLGIKMAKGEIILILESDNILDSKHWMNKMLEPFYANKKVFFTYSAYNSYKKHMHIITRYCALFGVTDPTLYFLKKSEKIPLIQKKYDRGEIIDETPNHYIVKFTKDNLPALGDNGHMFLKSAINKVNKDPKTYAHTDAVRDMVENGYDTFGVVKNSIIHLAKSSVVGFVLRKLETKRVYTDDMRGKRKYLIFDWNSKQDILRLIYYILASLTFVIPLLQSIRGYFYIRDRAWFMHPILCFGMVVGYSLSEIGFIIRKKTNFLRRS